MEVSGKRSLPSNNRCEDHGKELDVFCQQHNIVCCSVCVTHFHSNCDDFISVQEAMNVSSMVDNEGDLMKKMQDLLSKFEAARGGEREMMRTVDTQGSDFERRVRKFRENINKTLDKLETTMIMKKDEISADERTVLKGRIDVCDVAINNIKDSLTKIKTISKGVSQERSFIVRSKFRTMNEKCKEVLTELVNGKGKFSLSFIPNEELIKALDSLGSINVKSTTKPTQMDNGSAFEPKLLKIGELDVASEKDETISTITGACYLQNDTIILSDESNSSLKMIPSGENNVSYVKKLSFAPWDVESIGEDEIIVRASSGDSKTENKLYVYKVSEVINDLRTFEIDGRPRAVSYHNGDIYIAASKGDELFILKTDTHGEAKNKIIPKKKVLCDPQYLLIHPSNAVVYVSDFKKGIAAVNIDGGVIFRRPNTEIDEFGGLAIDDNGDLFVCAGKPYGIYRVNPDGSGLVPFITWTDDTVDPQALAFNKSNRTFLVLCCRSNKALVYGYV
ncbi:hypothetical protein DPMN_176535 [Dreissena polymorpha]|uniref:B box-type domain-containing protein n=1 Tax=Dreissena polymorpha TaxID=45954 RepID=A0A9D4E9A0_DREPO|nr:hypothetical protein DPMN_176535 [Dreissena polymorpha]